eukprot:CAMPEP_0174730688 /NCGR_PEP_ID=MMETSP1094-20130205/56100_1 /TAXON_ID=156173 /ORGANISM="Chrysochromulina brevifilum, Strain UTEX LB 985" /LENGTH=310 /DNA_ID=CAMNT_0015932975 /DNA_START=48 /DNA_END=977 /DNA_ORIENTATION=+
MMRWIATGQVRLMFILLVVAVRGRELVCPHDAIAQNSGGVRDLGYFFSPQNYDEVTHGRRTSATAKSSIRINLQYVDTSELTTAKDDFLRNTLLPAAVSWIDGSLSVVPVAGNLLFEPFCSSTFPTKCAAATNPTCGSYTVPDSMLAAIETCTSCTTSGVCSGCTTSAAGTGLASTDFVLFVSAVTTSSCGTVTSSGYSGILAYAATCQRDQYDRPIMGHANFCPDALDPGASAWNEQKATAVHELLHALGFSSGSWPLFRNADGTAQTARGSDGLPAMVPTACTDGVTRNSLEVNSSTLSVVTERGHLV